MNCHKDWIEMEEIQILVFWFYYNGDSHVVWSCVWEWKKGQDYLGMALEIWMAFGLKGRIKAET